MVSTWANSSTYPLPTLSPRLRDLPIYLGMPVVPADLSIDARWIVPMTVRGRVLENHTLVVRDGRIIDLLPSVDAAARYAPTVIIERRAHLLMPGMINAHTHAAGSLLRGFGAPAPLLEAHWPGPEFVHDGVLAAVAEMLVSGITCFGDRYYHPGETARSAAEQGMRAVIGLPVAETISAEFLRRSFERRAARARRICGSPPDFHRVRAACRGPGERRRFCAARHAGR